MLDATIFYLLFYQKTQESMQRIYLPILFYENFFNQILFQAYFFGIVEVSNKKAQSFLFANEGGGEWYGMLVCWYGVGQMACWYVGTFLCWYFPMLVWYDQMICCHVGMGVQSNGMIKWYVVMLGYSVSSYNLIANNLSYLQFDTIPP